MWTHVGLGSIPLFTNAYTQVKSGRDGDDFDRRVILLAEEMVREATKSKAAAPHTK